MALVPLQVRAPQEPAIGNDANHGTLFFSLSEGFGKLPFVGKITELSRNRQAELLFPEMMA
jgi:hypothetical protein